MPFNLLVFHVMVVLIELQITPIRSTSNLEPRSIWSNVT